MKIKSHSSIFLMFLIAMITCTHITSAECDNANDYCPTTPPQKQTTFLNGFPCDNPNNTIAHEFKSMELTKPGPRDNNFGSSVKFVTASAFSGLNTLGLATGRSDIEVDGLVSLHNHPRATEVIYVRQGDEVVAAFLDTRNQLFRKSLKAGDVFVVPRGLFHFLLNRGAQVATVLSVFNSQNPGLGSFTSLPSGMLDSVEKLKRKVISLSDLELDGVNSDLSSAVLDIIYS